MYKHPAHHTYVQITQIKFPFGYTRIKYLYYSDPIPAELAEHGVDLIDHTDPTQVHNADAAIVYW